MDKITQKLYKDAVRARKRLKLGKITYNKTSELIAPYLNRVNFLGIKIAKKYDKKFIPASKAGFLR